MATEKPLSVIALVSGGKDSFFSILHCLANGHRVVALANLYPLTTGTPSGAPAQSLGSAVVDSQGATTTTAPTGASDDEDLADEPDLNSFMYQTVGHQIIPLYAAATGLPLFRQPIVGTALVQGLSYTGPRAEPCPPTSLVDQAGGDQPRSGQGLQPTPDADETESLVPLLRAVLRAHPEANAISTGAILSTYQRTRVESVALRLGLVPLSYLWQFPVLPIPAPLDGQELGHHGGHGDDDAQLLRDMAAVGLEARIIKVASAGLDERYLWENVATEHGIQRVKRAMSRFGGNGGGHGAVLGEGGEFETLVLDGPRPLFKGRITVEDESKKVVHEGGGSAWLSIRRAAVEMKTDQPAGQEHHEGTVRIPDLLEARFKTTLERLGRGAGETQVADIPSQLEPDLRRQKWTLLNGSNQHWCFWGEGNDTFDMSIEKQTVGVVEKIRMRLQDGGLQPDAIISAVIVLRQMSDFPTINKLYGSLFTEPNPPSRITISSGDLLPAGSGIEVYLTIQPGLRPADRQGLHVQSRSYWAPANIGPYSQAIAVPLIALAAPSDAEDARSSDRTDAASTVVIAGQIPLIPASMSLPDSQPSDSVSLQVTLALQHLWRIGAEMHVQWWSSVVAYFPRTPDVVHMKQKAIAAAAAWSSAHLYSSTSDDEEDGGALDPWDRRYNSQYQSFGGDGDASSAVVLPDWATLRGFDDEVSEKQRYLPCFFAAEVEELPRQAGIEWHAHLGLSKVSPSSIHLYSSNGSLFEADGAVEAHHVIVESSRDVLVHSTVMLSGAADLRATRTLRELATGCANYLKQTWGSNISRDCDTSEVDISPYLLYVDSARQPLPSTENGLSIIPCRSLWTSGGDQLALVAVFKSILRKA